MNPLLKNLFRDPSIIKTGKALDVGFGGGEDALFLVQTGFAVTAIEKDPLKIDAFRHKEEVQNITLIEQDVTRFAPEPESFNFVLAKNTLPFVASKEMVREIIQKLVGALLPGGVFVLTLFGPRDAWVDNPKMSFFSFEEALQMFESMPVEMYLKVTEEGYGPTMKGDIKYWHIHRFVLRKRP